MGGERQLRRAFSAWDMKRFFISITKHICGFIWHPFITLAIFTLNTIMLLNRWSRLGGKCQIGAKHLQVCLIVSCIPTLIICCPDSLNILQKNFLIDFNANWFLLLKQTYMIRVADDFTYSYTGWYICLPSRTSKTISRYIGHPSFYTHYKSGYICRPSSKVNIVYCWLKLKKEDYLFFSIKRLELLTLYKV